MINFFKLFFLVWILSTQYIFSINPQEKDKPQIFKAEVTLCDGRTIKGMIEIQVPEKIIVLHEVNGLEFSKELEMGEIYSITLLGWSPELVENKPNKGKVYKFYVSRYLIELKDSLELKVVKKIPDFLEKFSFSNKMGRVTLYTYWIDLLKPDNTWYTGLNGPENGERIFCYKDVVKKIILKEGDPPKKK